MTINYLDVAWLTICGMLVFIMQAGFLCLEAGSTRSKNRINVIIKNLTDLGLSVLIFWALGYGLMFGSSWHGVIGIDRFLPNLGENTDSWTGSFFLFQAMFCSTAVTILSGATAERIQFKGYLAITALISGLIYPVYGHWVWQGIDHNLPGGWLAQKGFVDFAGATVVHGLGGWCSLAAVLVIGPRLGRFSRKRIFDDMSSTDLPIAFLGTLLLWFGWFGFNGGSNLIFNANVSNIIANTLIAGAAGVITPVIAMKLRRRPVDIKPMMNGAIAALVAVTSGCHAFSSVHALIVGAIGSLLMMAAGYALATHKIDDVVGAIPVHLVAGMWGTLAVGLLGNLEKLGTGLTRPDQIKAQVEGILACGLWAFGLSLIGLFILQKLSILRVSHRQEYIGLNEVVHDVKSHANDVFGVMKYHATTGNLRRRVASDPFTEVGRIGQWYNQVIAALETAIATNDAIIHTAVDGIVTLNRLDDSGKLIITSINPAVEKLFGYLPSDIIGQPFEHLLTQQADTTNNYDLTAQYSPTAKLPNYWLEDWLDNLAKTDKPQAITGKHRTGAHFPLELTATETFTPQASFFTLFLKDISAQQLAQEALLDSRTKERAKAKALEQAMTELRYTQTQLIQRERMAGQGQLVAGIAHEVNNPVNFIHGNLTHAQTYVEELLLVIEQYQKHVDKLPATNKAQLAEQLEALDLNYISVDFPKLLKSMKTGTERIRTIVQELRNFSRHDESDLKSVDFNASLESTLMVLAHRLEATSRRPAVQVIKHYSNIPPVECYASALNRATLSLLTNAVDAFDREANHRICQGDLSINSAPCITIKSQHKGDRLFLTLENNGPHIPKDELKRIFDPFFTTQPIGKGPGLGCTISHQIVVEQHKGQLSCDSKPGKGVKFTIELPLRQSTTSPVAAKHTTPSPRLLAPSPALT